MAHEMEIREWWDKHFPACPPAGFLLRQSYHERWLRIHSLPESKRYAETEDEYAELLNRHNSVATEVLGERASCYLIEGFWVKPHKHHEGWVVNLDGFEENLKFRTTETVWESGKRDALLRDVADWKRPNIVFILRESQRIYAPYDGGADLIFRHEQERDEMKQKYRAWLSSRPEGL